MTDLTTGLPPPSLKQLGKRPAIETDTLPPSTTATTTETSRVQQREKRVTRSSLGGSGDTKKEDSSLASEGVSPTLHLPLKTSILLTTRLLSGLIHYPPPSSSSSTTNAVPLAESNPPDSIVPSTSTSTLNGQEPESNKNASIDAKTGAITSTTKKKKVEEKPLFRLLDETETLLPRTARHAPALEIDTSDALYHRLHRYPEILEKRASRLERERLIHERSKLILELEELRGRGWVYVGNSSGMGGRAEEERQRKVRAGEERLRRYDALLPNQPRKSNFLNVSGSVSIPSTSASSNPTLPAIHTSSTSSHLAHVTSHHHHHSTSLSSRSNSGSPAPPVQPPIPTHSLSTRSNHHQNQNRPLSSRSTIPIRPTPLQLSSSTKNPSRRRSSISSSSSLRTTTTTTIPTKPDPRDEFNDNRPRTPVSASSTGGTGSTKIRIRFGGPLPSTASSIVPTTKYGGGKNPNRSVNVVASSSTTGNGTTTSKVVRKRVRSGGNQGDPTVRNRNRGSGGGGGGGTTGERKLPRRERKMEVSYAEDDEDDQDEEEEEEQEDATMKNGDDDSSSLSELEDDSSDEEEEDEEDQLVGDDSVVQAPPPPLKGAADQDDEEIDQLEDENEFTSSITPAELPQPIVNGRSSRASRRRRSSLSSQPYATSADHPPPMLRLRNSFFHSAALRDSIFPPQSSSSVNANASTSRPTRRSSARVAYAFGHRLPDAALLRPAEFELHGGTSSQTSSSSFFPLNNNDNDDTSSSTVEKSLEEMVRERANSWGQGQFVVVGRKVLPKSAVDAWMVDPVRNMEDPTSVASGVGSIGTSPHRMRTESIEETKPSTITNGIVAMESRSIPPTAPPLRSPSPSGTTFAAPKPSLPSPRAIPIARQAAIPDDSPPRPVEVPHQDAHIGGKPSRTEPGAGGGGGFSFALPSVQQVLFASAPTRTPSSSSNVVLSSPDRRKMPSWSSRADVDEEEEGRQGEENRMEVDL